MISVLFACLHRPNRSPSQRYRFEQYIDILNRQGYKTKISYLLNAKDDKNFYTTGNYFYKFIILIKGFIKRVNETFFLKKHDIVFVQRECFMLGISFFEKKFSRKSKLIFDFDDSIWLQNISNANKKLAFLKNPNKTKEIIKMAALVIAGNEFLANYALNFNKNVIIIPSTIDTEKYTIKEAKAEKEIVIGWSGSFSTIEHFETAKEALKAIKDRYNDKVVFEVIGDPNYRCDILGIIGKAWDANTEVEDLQYFDIGIMPLPDNEWTKGKCGMKGLQYMAAGIPTIMSPVGVNSKIIEDGENGFLAATTEEWINKLSLLIDSAELRKKFASNGRKEVERKYSIDANKEKYIAAMQMVLEKD